MLIEDFLSIYQFKESHSIDVNSLDDNVYQEMLHCDLSNSSIINFLCRLRGIPKGLYSIEHITKMGFLKLAEKPGEEIIFGMVTTSPVFNSCQSNYSASDFIIKSGTSILKAVINFRVMKEGSSNYSISTETRIWCGSKMKSKFQLYWFFVKPFSQLIRKNILKQIRSKIEKGLTANKLGKIVAAK